jgi:hypothetical protein
VKRLLRPAGTPTQPPDFTAAHPEIPWGQMRGMRNRMAHGYFDIDLNITSSLDLVAGFPPRLHAAIERYGTLEADVPQSRGRECGDAA